MERDYARRAGKLIVRYGASANSLTLDDQKQADLFGLLLARVGEDLRANKLGSVGWVLRGLRARHFEVLTLHELNLKAATWAASFTDAIKGVSRRNGFIVLALDSGVGPGMASEIATVINTFGNTRLLVALLAPDASSDLAALIARHTGVAVDRTIQLWPDDSKSAAHRLDDLIVAAYGLYS